MTSTQNRCYIGTRVYCFDKDQEGTVVYEKSLGLPFAPIIEFSSGERAMYCGEGLKDVCQYVLFFTTTMSELGYSEDDIASFRRLWFQNTNRETQRRVFGEGLEKAKEENNTGEYIKSILNTLNN